MPHDEDPGATSASADRTAVRPVRPILEGPSSLLAVVSIWIASFLASWLALAAWVAATAERGGSEDSMERLRAWVPAHAGTIEGVLILLLPGQATFLAASWIFAGRTRGGAAGRLGLRRGKGSIALALLCVLGTLGVQWASSVGLDLAFHEPSASMREMWKLLSAQTGAGAVLVGALITIVPGVCEEVLFRGVGQRGFLGSWPPLASIGLASALFALAHMDGQYSLAVLPLGLWLGFIAWKTDSLWIPILCHAANNLSAFVFGRLFGDPETGSLPNTPALLAAGGLFCLAGVLAARGLHRLDRDGA